MAPLRATTRAAGFFVLQYIPAFFEGLLEEEMEEDFYEEANRKGDGEKNKNRDINRADRSRTFRPNFVGVHLFQADGAIVLIFRTGNTHKMSQVLVTFYEVEGRR